MSAETISAVGELIVDLNYQAGLNFYKGSVSGPGSFGNDSIGFGATSGSGDLFGIFGYYPAILVAWTYNSGSSLSSTSTYANQSIASLHLIPGKYVWTWGTGPTADSFTLEIGDTAAAATPEPATFGLFALTGLGLMALRRRSRMLAARKSLA